MRAAALLVAAAVPTAGKPTMTLLRKKCAGVVNASEVAAGAYTIRVTATGAKGFKYTCDAAYDPTTEKADKECIGWVNGEEDIYLKLAVHDSEGKAAVCMEWKLAFGRAVQEDAWWPTDAISEHDPVKSARVFFDACSRGASRRRPGTLRCPGTTTTRATRTASTIR